VIRIIVTGDRHWTNHALIHHVLEEYCRNFNFDLSSSDSSGNQLIVTHGDADGADKIAGWAVRDLQPFYPVFEDPHPAKWYRLNKQNQQFFFKGAGPERNDEMLELQDPPPSLVLAFHNNLVDSKGTKHCVLSAIRRKFPVILFTERDGVPAQSSLFHSTMIPFQGLLPQVGRPEEILEAAIHRLTPLTW
jgi:hypothetical protein